MIININNELKTLTPTNDHLFKETDDLVFVSSEAKGQWHDKVWHPEVYSLSTEEKVYEDGYIIVNTWFVVPTKVLFDQLGYSYKTNKVSTTHCRHVDQIKFDLTK